MLGKETLVTQQRHPCAMHICDKCRICQTGVSCGKDRSLTKRDLIQPHLLPQVQK